jgi:acyl carrier protein
MSDLKQRLGKLSSAQRSTLAAKLQKMAVPRPGGGTQLVAYVVPEAGQSINTAELRASLANRLPEYMLPSQIIPLDAMPLTPNGKLDRAALPQVRDPQADDNGFVEPGTVIEKEIARVWAGLLGFDMIGLHDNFFELGGHSLLVIQAIARLRDRFHVELGVTTFFERPTIAKLAEYISEQLGNVPAGEQRDEMEF